MRQVRLRFVLGAAAVALAAGMPFASPAQETTVAHGLSTFGELKYPDGFAQFDYVEPDAPRGGTMSFRGTAASTTFDSLNAFIVKGDPAQGLSHLYDTLMARAEDEPDAVYGLIAASVEYPPDFAWVAFDLRPEARFSDGAPITPADVAFTFEALREKGHPYYRAAFEGLAAVRAEGPARVRFDFAPGAGSASAALEIATTAILPAAFYDDHPFEETWLDPPVGSGAYAVRDVDPGRGITYCRLADYWGADLAVNRGRDNFDCYRYEYFLDTTAAFEAFKAGEYLFHEEFSSALWATNYAFPALDRGWVVRETLPDERPSGAQGFWFNLRRPHWQDIRVREAVGLVFNFEWSNETLFYGLYERTDSLWENSDLQAEGIAAGAERAALGAAGAAPEVIGAPAVVPEVSGTRQLDRAALGRASALLEAAGWQVGGDGLRRNADGETLALDILYDNPSFERIVLPFVANLEALGIAARSDIVDPATLSTRRDAFDYDLTVARWALPQTPSSELRALFGSATAMEPGTLNLTGLADPVVDRLVALVLAAGSREELAHRTRALDRVLRAQRIWIPHWYKAEHWIARWDVFGRPAVKPRYARGEETWWIDAEKLEALRAAGALR